MNVLGLIPARGGSKGIPGKNIAPLAGRPLLYYTCAAALESRHINRVILSTDDTAIADIGRECGVEAPFLRPEHLSGDDAKSIDVARHAIAWLEEHVSWKTDILVLLQPTSPLRQAWHIDEALELFLNSGADTVVSVVEVPHRYSPYSIMKEVEGRLVDFWDGELEFDRYRRQDQPKLYARNGPAVLATRSSVILTCNSFYGDRVSGYLMNADDSIDIDSIADLNMAEAVLRFTNRPVSRNFPIKKGELGLEPVK